ncbi:MAG: ion channel, partial [Planctomycetota bacterium]
MRAIRDHLRALYHGDTRSARVFQYWLAGFDFLILAYIVASSFFPREEWMVLVDFGFGVALLIELVVRLLAAKPLRKELLHPQTLLDLVVVASLILPLTGHDLAFLRVLRITRVMTAYRFIRQLRADVAFFRNNTAAVNAGVNLVVFLFLMTALVYETQHRINEKIQNYGDALYFTVTALTTTGFGDITLVGGFGRFLSVVIMILGVTLFLQLATALFRARRVHWKCTECGLLEHEEDALNCR